MSVPHIDVNADGCRAKQVRSCKNTACRGGIPYISVVFQCLQRLDDLQNWHHFQTVVSFYCNVLNFAVAYSRAFVSLSTSAGFERLIIFCLTSAGLERIKHVKVFEGRFQRANIFGGRLQRSSPFLIRWTPRRERGWVLSETREKLQKNVFRGGNLANSVVS